MKRNKVISVFKNASAGNLYIEFYDNLGKKKQKSTGLKANAKNRKYVYQVVVPAFEQELENRSKPQKIKHPLEYYGQKYLESLRTSNNCKVGAHQGRIKKIVNTMGAETFPEVITELDVEDFIQSLDVSRETMLDWLLVFRNILDRAVKDRAISENVARKYKVPKSVPSRTPKQERMPFSIEESEKILKHAPTRLVNFFAINFKLGLRIEETLSLRIEDIEIGSMTVHVHHVITNGEYKPVSSQKGGPRNVPLFAGALEYIQDQITRAEKVGSEFLFFDENIQPFKDSLDIRGNGRKDEFYWNDFLTKLEIFPIRKMKNMRHTFAVQAIKSNKFTLQEIASMMGHSSLRMLVHHYGKYLGDAAESVDREIDIY